jgi:hypothetical protein
VLRAYFDTTVYSELHRHTEPGDIARLRGALQISRICAYVSPTNISELFGQADTNRPAAIGRMRLARDLVGFHHGLLKEPTDLLSEAVTAYANDREPPSPLVTEHQRSLVAAGLTEFINRGRGLDGVVSGILADAAESKDRLLSRMREAQAHALEQLVAKGIEKDDGITFEESWRLPAVLSIAEGLAELFGCVDACRERGLQGLLRVRVLRLGLGVMLSQVYSQLVPSSGNRRSPDRGDGFDAWHAVHAGAYADAILTFDGRLADHLERIPDTDGFSVVRTVPALLALVAARSR